MFKHLKTLTLLLASLFMAAALLSCDGRSGSSGVPYDGSSVDGGPTTTVRTKVALAYTLARGPSGEVVQMAATEADYRSASVKLTLPDGRILVMSYDGAGEYSCKVENLPAGSAGFIAAEFGGVVVKNFFDGLTAQGGAMDTGLTNPDSTLAADALAAFAQALAPVEGGYSVAELLSSVQNATLDIDVAALRTQIEDGQVAGYELARQSYNSILVWDNIDLTTGAVANLIESDTEVDTLNQLIANGGIRPPMRSNLAVEAKLVVSAFLDEYMNTRTVDAISPYLADTNFLSAGDDKPQFMLSALDEWSTSPKYLNLQSADLAGLSYAVTEAADFTGAASAMYLVAVSGTYDLTYVGPQTVTRAWDGTSTGFYVGKVGGEWLIFGDRMRMWFDYSVGYFNTSNSGMFTELSFELGNSGTFTPVSVAASNADIFGASNPVGVTVDPLALTPRYHFTLEGAQDTTWSFYDIDSYVPTEVPYVGIDSKIVTITATYAGATPVEEHYRKVIRIKEPTTVITGFTQSPEGHISVSWRPPLIDQQLMRVEVRLVGHGLNYTLPASDRDITIPASALSNAGLSAGTNAALDVVYFTPTSELAARQLFTYQGSTVIPRTEPPTFSPAPGVYLAPQAVAITSATSGASIYYTTDGTSPTFAGTPYTGPVTVDQSMTLKAIAVAAGRQNSTITTGVYELNIPPVLTIITRTLPDGLLGVPYSRPVVAAGGDAPYTWALDSGAPPTGLTLDTGTGLLSGTPTAAGTFTFTVRVFEQNTNSVIKAYTVNITDAPVISTSTLPGGLVGTAYNQSIAASGGVPPYAWSVASGALPGGLTLDAATGAITGTPTAANTFNFTVRATGANTLYVEQPFSITVTGPPTIATTTLPGGVMDSAYSQTVAATGGVTPYAWSVTAGALPDGLTLDGATGAITGTPTVANTFSFTVRATGANTLYVEQPLSIVITGPPTITTTTLPAGTVTIAYSQTVAATGGVTPYAWTVTAGALPDGLTLSTDGTLSGTPTSSGVFNFTVRATGANALFDEQPLSITISDAPVISTTTLPDGLLGTAYNQTVAAAGGISPYTWTVTAGALPNGLTLDGATGAITGTPTVANTFTFTVRATGTNTLFDEQALSIVITGAPTITTTTLPGGTLSAAYSQTVAATGGTTPYAWSVTAGALPDGLTLDGATGAITGTPTVANTFNFTVRATGANTLFDEQALSIVITGAPTITTTTLPGTTVGAAYSQSVAATGGTTPYAWTVTAGALPDGLTLDGASGAISGTPTTAGAANFTVRCTGANLLFDEQALAINVIGPVTITTTTLPSGDLGDAYSQNLAAAGGAPSYTWSMLTGTLPTGVTLSSGGVLSGTPSDEGDFTFTAQVNDTLSQTDAQTLTLSIIGAPTITTTSLPNAQNGAPYSTTIAATGGRTPYAWSLLASAQDNTGATLVSSFPPGLSINPTSGVFSGTPTAAGTYSFWISCEGTNLWANAWWATLTVTAAPTAPTITTSTLPDGTVGTAYSQVVAATGGTTPYTWSTTSGALPDGLALNPSTGEISGTPTAANTFNFTVRATGANTLYDEQAFTVTISGAPTIQTTSLPDGAVGIAYTQNLSATGSTTPYTWTLATGSLPDGLSLSTGGAITGTPTTTGAASFSVRCTGANGLYDEQNLTVTITAVTTVMASKKADGTRVAGTDSGRPSITPDGRYMVFETDGAGLDSRDNTATRDIYRKDLSTGELTLISVNQTGTGPGNNHSYQPRISDDGNLVVFQSTASNLVVGDTNGKYDVFLRDIAAGTTTRVSLDEGGNQISLDSVTPSISGDGKYVSFSSPGAVMSGVSSGSNQVYVRRLLDGRVELASRAVGASGAQGNSASYRPALSFDGRKVAFDSLATNLVTPTTTTSQIFVRDLDANTIVIASVSSGGTYGNLSSYAPMISADGTRVAFESLSYNLVTGDVLGGKNDIFLRDLSLGMTWRMSQSAAGVAGDRDSSWCSISPDGRYVTFVTDSTNLITGDTNGLWDAFLKDSVSGEISRFSLTSANAQIPAGANGFSSTSADGRFAAFDSAAATGVTTDDTVNGTDVFLRYLGEEMVAPAITITGGGSTFSGTTGVTVAPSVGGSAVFYSLDGGATWQSYTAPFTISATTTVNAYATYTGQRASKVATATFVLESAPTITTTTLPDGVFGQTYTNTISASGGSTPYVWTISAGTPIDGVTLGNSSGQLSGVPSGAGTYTFTVRCTGADALFDEQAFTVTISGVPTIQTTSLPDGAVGTAYTQNLSAIGSTTPYTWTLNTGSLPDGLGLSVGGVISGTPTTAGAANFTVRCTGANGLSSTMSLSINVIGPVTITTASVPSGDRDDPYSQTLTVAGGVAPYTWSIATGTLPTGVTLSTAGVLSGTPSIAGDFNFTARVTDNNSQVDTQLLTLTILAEPTITTTSLPNAQVSVVYSSTVNATGGRPPYAWSLLASAVDEGTGETLVSTFPPGLSINPTSGILSGTPTTAGTYSFWIMCEGANLWANAWWATLTVIAGPAITNASLPQAVLNGSYSQGLTVAGGTSPYSFAVISGALPDGLTLNTGNGLISGTATVLGDFNFTVQVTDNVAQSSSRALSIAVNERPVIGTVGLENGTVGTAYSQTLAASKGDLPYNWSISVGGLPDGIALTNSSGLISGTPSTAGTTPFTVRCTAASGLYAERAMSITVDPAGTALPKINPPSGINFGGAGGMTVTVSHAAPGALVYVTIDGTDPSPTNFNFNGASPVEFSFNDTMTVKAMVTVAGSPNSGVASAIYNALVTVGPTGTFFASADASGTQGNLASGSPELSGDGRFVAFESLAGNLTGGTIIGGIGLDSSSPQSEIFVKDRQTGTTTILSRNIYNAMANGDSSGASISFDGRYVAFWSLASDLVSDDTNFTADVFVRDTQTGELTRISVAPDGTQGNGGSFHPAISGDGRYVAFQSAATNLVTGDTNGFTDIFVRDMWTGAVARASVASDGTQGDGQSLYPAINHDGSLVVFASDATTLISTDANGFTDIYLRDMKGGKTARLSRMVDGPEANGNSNYPSIDASGRRVAFESRASNLVAGDTNSASDIFVADTIWSSLDLISVGESRGRSNGDSYFARISADGNTVAFQSYASNLVPSATESKCNVFVRDLFYLESGLTTLVTLGKDGMPADNGSYLPSLSSDGRYVAYQSDATNLIVGDANGVTDIFATDTFRAFADPNIRAEIARQTGKTEPFSPLDLYGITVINLGDGGGSNLMGLQYLPSLFELDLSLNGVTDFTPLVACGKLTTLNLEQNQITSLAPLAHFPNLAGLTYLNLNSNLIEDLSPLAGQNYMPDLRVRSNKLTSIAPIRGIAFDNLDISLNCIADTSGLTATTLTDIGQDGACPVAFADPILRAEVESILGVASGTPLLYGDVAAITDNIGGAAPVLNLSNLGITDLAGIEWLDGVQMVDLSGNPGAANLASLGGMKSLFDLKFGASALTDLMPLAAATNLTRLSVPDNQISDVSPTLLLTQLANFDFSNNYVTTAASLLVHPTLTTVNISDNCILNTGELSQLSIKFGAGLTNTGQSGKCL